MSGLRKSKRFRRLLRGLPEAMRSQLVGVLERGGPILQGAMRVRAPKRTGFGVQGIKYRVYPKSLRLRVGLIDTPAGRAKRFYMRIQDLGRRAQTVTVRRRRRVASEFDPRGILRTGRGNRKRAEDIVATYQMRVRAMAPKRFVTGKYPELRRAIGGALRGIWTRALNTLAGGSDG